jgi:Ala-tRNA(Pro) deacylase
MSNVLQSLRDLLDAAGMAYRTVQHEPTYTSEESARARGEELHTGGKALLMKTGDEFRLLVLPADRKVDSNAVRAEFGVKKLRFASADELRELTGLIPGSVPPFGRPILPFPLYVDAGISTNPKIAFNAGSLTDSIILATEDYLRVAKPERVFPFAASETST